MPCELSCSVLSSIREACEGTGCWRASYKHCPGDDNYTLTYPHNPHNCPEPLISGADWCCPTSTGKVVVLVILCIAALVGGGAILWYKGLIGNRVPSQTSTMNTPLVYNAGGATGLAAQTTQPTQSMLQVGGMLPGNAGMLTQQQPPPQQLQTPQSMMEVF
jgi:hypothetical protein